MEVERLILACLFFLFAWIPTGGESAPVSDQDQFDMTTFTDAFGNSPSEEERTRVEDELTSLIVDILSRGYWSANDVYDDVSSDELYEAEALSKRGKGNGRSGGRSSRRRPSSDTMHATAGFGKRTEYKKTNQQYRPKPLLTWRH
ncbi:hypothetical protein HOLleu_19458 [Holothuria leucospilota]|uniref:Uncharacterized protein n=1 Tax=Holothuria leucospilota TaxID=206669 RepID=A0A9Q1H7T8_HOLLE|nr:hypothetical protein HOLleu_19458 [Holothuria leucospilota]